MLFRSPIFPGDRAGRRPMNAPSPPAPDGKAASAAATGIPQGRVAAVDYGRKRIGIAICDVHRILASPLCVRQSTGDAGADAAFFRKLAAEESVAGFVVGLPVHADGTDSRMSVEVERFGAWLAAETGLPVVFHDERYSSREASGQIGRAHV